MTRLINPHSSAHQCIKPYIKGHKGSGKSKGPNKGCRASSWEPEVLTSTWCWWGTREKNYFCPCACQFLMTLSLFQFSMDRQSRLWPCLVPTHRGSTCSRVMLAGTPHSTLLSFSLGFLHPPSFSDSYVTQPFWL